jgi:hypothetical protein
MKLPVGPAIDTIPEWWWKPKFELRPIPNALDPTLLKAAYDYWRYENTPNGVMFREKASDIDHRLRRESGPGWSVTRASVTHAVREAFDLVCVFKCHICRKTTEQYLDPLRSVLDSTNRRPLTLCPACVAESAKEHDESEVERSIEFLERKIKPGTCTKAVPIVVAAKAINISDDYLERARLRLGIQIIAVGRGWMLAREKVAVGTDDSQFKGWNSRPVSDAIGKQVFEQALEQADEAERREIYLHAHPRSGRKWIAMTKYADELAKALGVALPEVKEDDSYVVWAQGWYSFEEVRNG